MRPRRRGGSGFGLFLLAAQILQVGYNHIPPTTLATIGLNVAIYLKVLHPFLRDISINPSISSICVSSYYVWYKHDWTRLLLAGWFHLDDWHLYYNMVSLLWKGRGLEPALGSVYFAYVLLVFSVLTHVVMVGVNIAAAELLQEASYVTSCAAGFSGVLFALKVLSSYYMPAQMQHVFGIPVPSKWACWIELVVIQLLVPNASFTGHLAGILVGLAYVNGPLKTLMDIIFSRDLYVSSGFSTPSYTYSTGTTSSRRSQSRPGQRSNEGSSGGRTAYTTGSSGRTTTARSNTAFRANDYTGGLSEEEQISAVRAASTDYTAGMSEEEQVEAAMRESLRIGESSVSRTSSHTSNVSSPTLPSFSHRGPSTSSTTYPQNKTPNKTQLTSSTTQGITRPFSSSTSSGTQPSTSSTTHNTTPFSSVPHPQSTSRPLSQNPNPYLRQRSADHEDYVRRMRLNRLDQSGR